MSREFALAWRHLREGGAIIADDVDANPAFAEFAVRVNAPALALAEVDRKSTAFGVTLRG